MKQLWSCLDLPIVPYEEARALQVRLVEARRAGLLDRNLVLLVEHPPVFTLGRRGGSKHIIVSEDFLSRSGIPVLQTERGGAITFHGPGQLVVYFIIDLYRKRLGVADYVKSLEEVMIRVAAEWGIEARRDSRNAGVWVNGSKLGSIGIAIRRGIAFHGLALNVNVSLAPFGWIQPCGLDGIHATSMAKELGGKVEMAHIRGSARRHIEAVFDVTLEPVCPGLLTVNREP